jgi:hypothetical protein
LLTVRDAELSEDIPAAEGMLAQHNASLSSGSPGDNADARAEPDPYLRLKLSTEVIRD